jgi:hypothetical protein
VGEKRKVFAVSLVRDKFLFEFLFLFHPPKEYIRTKRERWSYRSGIFFFFLCLSRRVLVCSILVKETTTREKLACTSCQWSLISLFIQKGEKIPHQILFYKFSLKVKVFLFSSPESCEFIVTRRWLIGRDNERRTRELAELCVCVFITLSVAPETTPSSRSQLFFKKL